MTVCAVDGCGVAGKIIKGLCQRCYLKAYYRKNTEKLKTRAREWERANPERAKANHARKKADDPARYAAYGKAWAERNPGYPKEFYYANRNELLAKKKAWRDANPELVKELKKAAYHADVERSRQLARASRKRMLVNNPECLKAAQKRFKANNKDKVNADTHKRRARIKGGGGKYTRAAWQAILEHHNHTCPACGARNKKLTVDHVVPIAMGGANTADNIQPLCKSCNSRKHVRHTTRYEPWPTQSADAAE
jgi:5-methylcytosine-specific restriction endonuclease McrA